LSDTLDAFSSVPPCTGSLCFLAVRCSLVCETDETAPYKVYKCEVLNGDMFQIVAIIFKMT